MKNIQIVLVCALATLFSNIAFSLEAKSDDPNIKITSFEYLVNGATPRNPTAELCGTVLNPTGTAQAVKVVVDFKAKTPATYNTMTSKDGKFCLIVATYSGLAEASLE